MIIVDSSAIMAILEQEPEADAIITQMQSAKRCIMAAPTKLELMMVAIGRKRESGKKIAELIFHQYEIEIFEWTNDHANIATEAFLRFGKGRHPAALNFGDCMSYALAKHMDAPLLYKGGDFSKTDIRPAL